ncbi:MAG: S8 family serine peptidase, partial [Rudaea sp.]
QYGYTITNPLGSGNYIGQCGVADISLAGCNDKVIGVYDEIDLNGAGPPYSVEDTQGHGSHTASTAGGDFRSATLAGYTANIAGVAPHANLVIYYACSPDPNVLCSSAATSSAVDDAVQAGIVDALNYSISGGSNPWNDPTSMAFLGAEEAGIFVAAAAGNTGGSVPVPVPGSANHAEPWVTTVAAANHTGGAIAPDFSITGPGTPPANVQNQPLTEASGDTPPTATITAPVILSPNFDASDLSGTDGCSAYAGGQFTGGIALVSRGTCSFYVKVENALAAGAVAVLISDNRPEAPLIPLVNDGGVSSGDVQPIPVYSLTQQQGLDAQTFLNGNSGTAPSTIPFPPIRQPAQADELANFSLLGPVKYDEIKPDVQAPGVDILAAIANDGSPNGPNLVALYNGTSMATPHTTGSGILMFGVHSDWTPMEAKSALMMTAKEAGLTKPDGITPSDYFDRGSGRLQDFIASKAGLVLNETGTNFLNADPAVDGNQSTLNLASMQNGNCITVSGPTSSASCSFTRTFRGTADHTVTYTAAFTGVTATATPSSLTVHAHASGQSITVNVDASAYDADGVFHFGEMTLTPSDTTLPTLHLPIAVKVPPPTIAATPSPLSVDIPNGFTSSSSTLTVANTGGPTLNVSNTNDTTGTTSALLLDQPSQGNFGFYSVFFTDIGAGAYAADDFAVAGLTTNLSKVSFPGFVTGATGLTGLTGHNIHFEIYADSTGVPAGQPESAPSTYFWNYVATIGTTAGLDVTGNTISLDLAAAGAPPTALPAGTYWFVVWPEIAYDGDGNGWAWFESENTFGNNAHNIDPDHLFMGTSGNWEDNTDGGDFPGMAMHLEVAATCGAPWLSTTPGTLSIGAHLTAPLTVTADSALFPGAASSASAYLCLDSNDPAHPIYAVPVNASQLSGAPPPTVSKSFAPASVLVNDPSTATITLDNPGASVATLTANLVDTLPADLVATAGSASTDCTNGTVGIAVDGTSVTLTSGSQIPASGSCTVSFTVSSPDVAIYTNTIAAGDLQTDQGNNVAAGSATLAVNVPPTVTSAFSPTSVAAGTPSTLTITFTNPNAGVATLTSAFDNTLPTGVVVATTPNAASTCSGGTLTANAGDPSFSLGSGAQIPASGSCTTQVDVTAAAAGVYTDTVAAAALVTDLGSSTAASSDNVVVTGTFPAPYCSVSFPSEVDPITSVVFAGISNTSSATVNGTPSLENFLSVTPGTVGQTGYYNITVKANTAGPFTDYVRVYFDWNHDGVFNEDASERYDVGSITNSTGTDGISADSGVFVPASAISGLTRMRVVHAYGSYSAIAACDSTLPGVFGQAADYLVTVDPNASLPPAPPFVSKAFSPNYVSAGAGGTSTLTITLNNYNATDLATTADFTDTFPSGLVVAATPNASTTCTGSPTVTAGPGDGALVLGSGATIPGSGACTVQVDVTTATGGIYVNTIPAGAVQSANGNSPGSASATVQFASATPTYSAGFESAEGFTVANITGQNGWYSSTGSYFKVVTTNPQAGTQEFRAGATTAGTGTPYSLSPIVPVGTSTNSIASADVAVTAASTGETFDFRPQDNDAGLILTDVEFLKGAGNHIYVLDASDQSFHDTGATWTGGGAYQHLDVVVNRSNLSMAVCLDGTPIYAGTAFAGSASNVAIEGTRGTGTSNNYLDVDNLVLDNLNTVSCTPPAAPVVPSAPVVSGGSNAVSARSVGVLKQSSQ